MLMGGKATVWCYAPKGVKFTQTNHLHLPKKFTLVVYSVIGVGKSS